jgi:hypothetical protein
MEHAEKAKRIGPRTYLYRGVKFERDMGTAHGYWGAWRTTGYIGNGELRAGSMSRIMHDIDRHLVVHAEQIAAANEQAASYERQRQAHRDAIDSVIGRMVHGVWVAGKLVAVLPDAGAACLKASQTPSGVYGEIMWEAIKRETL